MKIKHSQNFYLPDFVEVVDGNIPQFVVKEFSYQKDEKKTISYDIIFVHWCVPLKLISMIIRRYWDTTSIKLSTNEFHILLTESQAPLGLWKFLVANLWVRFPTDS